MSDPTGGGESGATGLLEGLAGGFEGGYGFRENIKARRRNQQLFEDLHTLRQQEAAREAAQTVREGTIFDEQQAAYKRALALRSEVAAHLASPTRFRTLGQYISGQPGEHTGAPLSPEARAAQAVGGAMLEFGGRPSDADQALLVGSGMVPSTAIAPKAYHPKTRAEWLDNLRIASGLRGQSTKLPITMDHAFTVLDRIYTQQDPQTGAWRSHLSPGDRLRIAKKMVAGTVQPGDFPDIKDESGAPAPAQPSGGGGRNLWQRVGDFFTGGPKAPTAPGGPPMSAVPPDDSAGRAEDRLTAARAAIADYRDLPDDELRATLKEQGFDEDEINEILGGTGP